MTSTLRGTPAATGVAIGAIHIYDPSPPQIPTNTIASGDIKAERARLNKALDASKEDLVRLRDHVAAQIGKEEAAIFEAHLLMLEDEELLSGAYQRIETQLMNAEQAIWEATGEFAQILAGLEDSYFQARATDLYDLRARVVAHLQGRTLQQLRNLDKPVIVAARDLLPSDTAGLDQRYVLGIVTEQGGPTSHTAILARQLGIPAVVGVSGLLAALSAAPHDEQSQRIAMNGGTGSVVVAPDEQTIAAYKNALQLHRQRQQQLSTLHSLPAVTPDGVAIELAANIGRPQDAPPAVESGAGGVGLFRTEFLFLDRNTAPSEEEQLTAYSSVLTAFAGKTVIVRTLDIGGDKSVPYMSLPQESNPFLGLRGIRLCLDESYLPLFRTQLRALLRAAAATGSGNNGPSAALWIMFPMIDDLRELRQAKAYVAETEAALLQEGKLQAPIREKLRMGIMVETPSAALLIDMLAKEADFFSIGTNDLAQYTLACDRMNSRLVELHRPFHPAVMRSIAQIISAARQHQRWVGMCGEMAGDPRASAFLLGLGINELSMEASSLNAVKEVIRKTPFGEAQAIVQRVLAAESADEIEALLKL